MTRIAFWTGWVVTGNSILFPFLCWAMSRILRDPSGHAVEAILLMPMAILWLPGIFLGLLAGFLTWRANSRVSFIFTWVAVFSFLSAVALSAV